MHSVVALIKQFRIFAGLNNNKAERLSFNLVDKTYKRGQNVYQQAVSTTDGVYFIKTGEFEIL